MNENERELRNVVFLHAREWIEIINSSDSGKNRSVFLHAREWIEIPNALNNAVHLIRSFSMRESGLKLDQ